MVGPPGAGKTTYCAGMQQFLSLAGRKVAVVNLDPANDAALPYTPAVDVGELVALEGVQAELGLGPNGGLVWCIDYLEQNLDWLAERLAPLEEGESAGCEWAPWLGLLAAVGSDACACKGGGCCMSCGLCSPAGGLRLPRCGAWKPWLMPPSRCPLYRRGVLPAV